MTNQAIDLSRETG